MMVLGKGIIRAGDQNVLGGQVMTGSPAKKVLGRAVARIGDLVDCPLHGINQIIEGCPSYRVMGVPVALDGHVSECGCALVSSFQASPGLNGAGLGAASADRSSTSGGQAVNPTRYDEQIKFLLGSGAALDGMAYTLTLDDGKKIKGITDAEGKTARIESDERRFITSAHLTPRRIFCCAKQADNAGDLHEESIDVKLEGIQTNADNVGSSVTEHVVKEKVRPLTTGEIAMAQLMFRDSIDYSKVKVHNGAYIPGAGANAITPNGEMYFPNDFYQSDYSAESDIDKIWFMHEMVHVWQYQLGYWVAWAGFKIQLKGGYQSDAGYDTARAYRYDATSSHHRAMSDFNMEQQGDLISHYFDAVYLSRAESEAHQKRVADLPFLQIILADFLRNPSDASLLPTTTRIERHEPVSSPAYPT
ncbi:PAAR domain-containing protein [Collimonas sp. H4R21]|uniref:PAAR domain-containing protein n=1 Tax=Collimonas rhizosphaerae TaxID=3126357 RepID=A0ABU9PWF5_9BURK